jgi:uncharacterized protein
MLLRVLVFLLGAGSVALAQVAVPPLSARVTDLTGTLTTNEVLALDQSLRSFEARKGSQIAVLVVPTTQPESIEQYGIRVAEQWKLGRKGVDDGAILIVARNDRTLRIEVGYGLEGVLSDAVSKRIISEVIVPRFRQGDFAGGITEGVNAMMRLVDGEPLPEPRANAATDGETPQFRHYAPVVLLLALVVGGVLRSILGKLLGAIVTGGVFGYLAWLIAGALSMAMLAGSIAFLVTLLGGGMIGPLMSGTAGGRYRGGSFGTGFGGGGGFGAGGGFRGGGGGFGGGGASGRW